METGTVAAVSQYGFRLSNAKNAPWYNWANEYEGERALSKGEHVEFACNEKGYVAALRRLDRPVGATEASGGPAPPYSERPADTNTLIVRQVAVKAAIEMLAHHAAWLESPAAEKVSAVVIMARTLEYYITVGEAQGKRRPDVEPDE